LGPDPDVEVVVIRALIVVAAMAAPAAAGRQCEEVSPIVGRQHCSWFADGWAHQWGSFEIEGGIAFEHASVRSFDQSGTVASPTASAGYRATLLPSVRRTMSALGTRYGVGYRGRHVIVAVETTIAFSLAAPISTIQVEGWPPITSSSAMLIDVGGVIGLHTRVEGLELSALVAIGVRTVNLAQNLPAGFTGCAGGQIGEACDVALSDTSLLVEPRLRIDRWMTSQVTLGLSVGFNVVERGESIGLTLGYHGAPFDGS
jgi:hypothetical protein